MSKRRNEHMSLEDALRDFVDSNDLQKGLDKVDVANAWTELMGNGVNSYTSAVRLQGSTLYVELSSSVLREELSYGKEKIIAMINEALGKPIVKKLILR
jgi:hypothetical protein